MGQENFSFSAPEPAPSEPPAAGDLAGDTAGELRRAARSGPRAPAPAEAPRKPPAVVAESTADEPAYTVSQLTRAIEGSLSALGRIRVEGEVADIRRASSGHVYFDLKEEGSLISCVVWRGQAKRALPAQFAEGAQVLARGKLDVYAPHGRYKLIVDRVEPLGVGALLAQLEELKAELKQAGMFERSRALPAFPRRIGVVTSRDGAALRDFLRTRSLRWPLYPVRLIHTRVQGPGAALEIAEAIERLDRSGVEVIVVTRGGGSLQDLWCFNERAVAEAIWRASVPVVSAVGHESDTSLSDLVADFRAHTPTDAAQTVIPDREKVCERITRVGNRLVGAAHECLAVREERLERLAHSRGLADPVLMLRERAARLRETRSRLELVIRERLARAREGLQRAGAAIERQSPAVRLARVTSQLDRLYGKLVAGCDHALASGQQRLELAARSLEAISPLAVLGRGYSITARLGAGAAPAEGTAEAGTILTDASDLVVGDLLETRLLHGRVVSKALEVRSDSTDEGGGSQAE